MSKYSDTDRWVFKDVWISLGVATFLTLFSILLRYLFPTLNIVLDYLNPIQLLSIVFVSSFVVFFYYFTKPES